MNLSWRQDRYTRYTAKKGARQANILPLYLIRSNSLWVYGVYKSVLKKFLRDFDYP